MEYVVIGILIVLVFCLLKLGEIASRLRSIDHTLLAEHQVSDSRFSTLNGHIEEIHDGLTAIETNVELIQSNTDEYSE